MVAAGVDSLLSLFPPGSALDPDGMLTVAGCRTDTLATQFDTPLLVVSEPALRARAREYADGLAARWPRSRVVLPPRRSRARRSSG
jgi:diaminopimelate decarboxylase